MSEHARSFLERAIASGQFDFGSGFRTPTGFDFDRPDPTTSSNSDLAAILAATLAAQNKGTVDHFFDVSPMDQAIFDETVAMNEFEVTRLTALDSWNQAMDERDMALLEGNQELAREKQEDANFWQVESNKLDIQLSAAANASREKAASISAGASIESSRISAQATIRSSEIQAATARVDSANRLRVGLANSFNDQERNRVLSKWNEEQAAISKMEDETRRLLGQTENQVQGFRAETERQNVAGQLAQRQNEFLLEASTSPRDLFGLYFLQRGITPDFGTIIQGGTPAQGEALTPVNPLTAFTPTLELPDFDFGGQAAGNVGAATAAATQGLSSNPFITGTASQTQPQSQPSDFVSSAGGTATVGRAAGGVTSTDPVLIVGDSPQADPQAGGARPEVVLNPTRAPIQVLPNGQTVAEQGFGNAPTGQKLNINAAAPDNGSNRLLLRALQEFGNLTAPRFADGGGHLQDANLNNILSAGGADQPIDTSTLTTTGDNLLTGGARTTGSETFGGSPGGTDTRRFTQGAADLFTANASNPNRVASMGIDEAAIQKSFEAMGLGNLFLQSSANPQLEGITLPPALQALVDFGVPIPPALLANLTGQFSPTLNVAEAFQARGGGALPSLQTLGNQTQQENQLFLEGFGQGVVGIPASTILDFISRPTRNLQTAARGSSAV